MTNIIGGQFKRKKIIIPSNGVRPTSAIKREAIFSMIESLALKKSYNIYKDRCFIDLFAGSGSFGLEAISRGASFVYFYEIDNEIIKILSKNCKQICSDNQYMIFQKDSLLINNFKLIYPLSVIFIDPPYKFNSFEQILDNIINLKILDEFSLVIIETHKNNKIIYPNQLTTIKEKIYGKTKIIFLNKSR